MVQPLSVSDDSVRKNPADAGEPLIPGVDPSHDGRPA